MSTELIEVCQEIGSIAERNNAYTYYLAQQLRKPVEGLTVSELLLHQKCLEQFNKV